MLKKVKPQTDMRRLRIVV